MTPHIPAGKCRPHVPIAAGPPVFAPKSWEALIKSTCRIGEQIFRLSKSHNRRNTLCISRFWGKDRRDICRRDARGDLFRGSLDILQNSQRLCRPGILASPLRGPPVQRARRRRDAGPRFGRQAAGAAGVICDFGTLTGTAPALHPQMRFGAGPGAARLLARRCASIAGPPQSGGS